MLKKILSHSVVHSETEPRTLYLHKWFLGEILEEFVKKLTTSCKDCFMCSELVPCISTKHREKKALFEIL